MQTLLGNTQKKQVEGEVGGEWASLAREAWRLGF